MSRLNLSGRVGINNFCRRQTAESKFSHCTKGVEWVAQMAQEWLDMAIHGDKPGSYLVPLPTNMREVTNGLDKDCTPLFYSGVVNLAALHPQGGHQIVTEYAPRKGGEERKEEPYLQTVVKGVPKLSANHAWAIIYSKDLLGADASTKDDERGQADFELVAFEVNDQPGMPPCDPVTMMRNQLGLVGGSPAQYTSEQWARAVHYWMNRAMWGGE